MTNGHPQPIRTDGSNDFAHRSMAQRVPSIIEDVIERNPEYSSGIEGQLRRLIDAIVQDQPMTLFDPPAPDYDCWARRFSEFEGESWLGTEWFFAETFAYRHLVDACRYWTTRRDPFRPMKEEEIHSEALRSTVGEALAEEGSLREEVGRRLMSCLWGNRMDLSMKGVLAQGTDATDEHLLCNDIPAVVDDLLAGPPGTVHILMDNAGTEQAFDLALVDTLLGHDLADTVILHVKASPVLVSDVLGPDIFWLLDVLEEYNDPLRGLAKRIGQYVHADRLAIIPDVFWSTDGRLWELPPRLKQPFETAQLVVSKGDAHYRRIGNDAVWPRTATLDDAVGHFPAPLLALRTVKSDTLVGIDADTVARLDEEDEKWRTKGTYGVIQYAP